MRTRIALSLGALLLAGGAAFAGTALATAEQPPAPTTTRPAPEPTARPEPGQPPRATTAPRDPRATPAQAPGPDGRPGTPDRRVPRAVPAGPVGDLHLPAIVEGAGN